MKIEGLWKASGILLALAITLTLVSEVAADEPKYLVEIRLESIDDLEALTDLGIHLIQRFPDHVLGEVSEGELATLAGKGFDYKVLREDKALIEDRRKGIEDVVVTRWVDPEGKQPITYEEWKSKIPPRGPFTIRKVLARQGDLVPAMSSPKVCVIVNSVLYNSIQASMAQYVSDLEDEGYTVEVYSTSGGTPSDLRTFLQGELPDLVGCLLVGDLPVPWYEMDDDFFDEYAEFPIDLFYMDLDGQWADADADGKLDDHTNGAGDVGPEIWVGRLTASPLSGNEVSRVRNYFTKNHQYRTGDLTLAHRALAYLDDDWYHFGDSDLDLIYGDNVTVVNDKAGTNAEDYKERLEETHRFLHVMVHSWSGGHGFHGEDEWAYVSSSEIEAIDPRAFFYNLFACSNARYVEDDYTGGHYIFTPTYGLAAIGSTKTGAMMSFREFYAPLGEGKTLGEAYHEWFDYVAQDGFSLSEKQWHYGMTLLADPTLTVVDRLAPMASILSPAAHEHLHATTTIVGSAADASFSHYTLEYGAGPSPDTWTQLSSSSNPVIVGTLATWDTRAFNGAHTFRLTVNGNGRSNEDRITARVKNAEITSPANGDALGPGLINIIGTAAITGFRNYVIEYGVGANPASWSSTGVTLAGGGASEVISGTLATMDTTLMTRWNHYTFRLTVNGSGGSMYRDKVVVLIDPTLQAGWAKKIKGKVTSSPAIGDVDDDRDLEIVVGSDDPLVYAWHHDGSALYTWPQSSLWYHASVHPKLVDLDGDRDTEIVAGSDTFLHVWDHNGNDAGGWPQSVGSTSSPAIGDLEGDGDSEVIIGSLDGSIYVFTADGSPVSGWPVATGGSILSSPALGDMDNDGRLEIVVGSGDARIYALHYDGTPVSGWPTETGDSTVSSPALGDIDGDGDLEIVVGSDDSKVYAWHHDGTLVNGWPVNTNGKVASSPALGDIDGDGDLEVVVGSDDRRVYALHHHGRLVSGWPVWTRGSVRSSPALGDIDGDGDLEIIVGSDDSKVYAFHHHGTPVIGWAKQTLKSIDRSSPAIGDIDGDGDIEVVIGSMDHNIYAWDLPGACGPAGIEWGTFHHDVWNTGLYGFDLPPMVWDVVIEPGHATPGSVIAVTARVVDDSGVASVTAEIESPDEMVRGTIALYDDGAHGDGAAGDGIYGNTWTTLLTKLDYVVDITAVDVFSSSRLYNNVARFTTQDVAYVQYDIYTINSDSINHDGTANPGEYVRFSITLENIGILNAPGVTATISTVDPYIWYDTGAASFGDIAAGGTATCDSYDYSFLVRDACPHSHTVRFSLDIGDSSGNTWIDSFEVTIIDNVGPAIWYADASPRYTVAGEPVTITARVEDGSGISSVQAVIESPDETPIAAVALHDDGAHGDGTAGDGIYGNSWATDGTPRDYYVDFVTEDSLANARVYDNMTLYTTKAFTKTADILFVPDYGDNSTDRFRSYYTNTLDSLGYTYDVWVTEFRGAPDSATLNLYTDGVVIWAVPYWGYFDDSDLRPDIQAYLDAGGKLFMTGQNVAQRLNGTALLSDYLHASYVQGDTNLYALNGTAGDPIGDGLRLGISGGDGANNQYDTDEIDPISPAVTVFTYDTTALTGSAKPVRPEVIRLEREGSKPGATLTPAPWGEPEESREKLAETVSAASPVGIISSGTGGLRVDTGAYKIVFFSFGFEAINSASDRATVMERVLAWLRGVLPRPMQIGPTDGSAVEAGDVTFIWTSMTGASGYQIQIDTVDTFDSPALIDDTVTDTSYTTFLSLGTWYWRVRALPDSEFTAAWQLCVVEPFIQVTDGQTSDDRPALMETTDGVLWLLWESNRTGNLEIWAKTSTDGGESWSSARQLTTDPSKDRSPTIMQATDGTLHFVWRSRRSGSDDLWYRTSSDGGATWSSPVQIADDPAYDGEPDMAQMADGSLWIVWQSTRNDHNGIWYTVSTDGGHSWSTASEIPNDPSWQTDPSIAQSGDGKIWVVWFRGYGLAYSTSTDGGTTWSAQNWLEAGGAMISPSIRCGGDGILWLVYTITRHVLGEWRTDVYYQTSSDNGSSWSGAQQLTQFIGPDDTPAVAVLAGGQAGFAWRSPRTGFNKIWFGILGTHSDVVTPPYVDWQSHVPFPRPDSDDTITVRTRAADDGELYSVRLEWIRNDEVQPELAMYDDGAHEDDSPGDSVYGVQLGPFVVGDEIGYRVRATDADDRVYTYPYTTTFQVLEPFVKTADILFVPDYGGNSTEGFRPYFTNALGDLGYSYDVWDTGLRGKVYSGTLSLYTSGVVIWASPYWGYFDDGDVRPDIEAYLDGGGKLFITGQNIAQYLNGTTLLSDYLHATFVQDDTDLYALNGTSADPIGDGLMVGISGGDGANNQYDTDEIDPISPAVAVFTYDTTAVTALAEPLRLEATGPGREGGELGATPTPAPWGEPEESREKLAETVSAASPVGIITSGTGGLRVDTVAYKIVFFSFGFEAINSTADRAMVMDRVLNWLLSPPTRPVVTDDGDYTTNDTQLHAIWTSSDPETGISEYQYAIGTMTGGADIVSWTSVGTSTEITVTGLSLTEGQAYTFTVKAKNGDGIWSLPGSSNGIIVDTAAPSSRVIALPAYQVSTTFTVTWTGRDATSGVATYDVQYRDGITGTWSDWLTQTTLTSSTFTGQDGHTYYFQCRAKDEAGNMETYPGGDGDTWTTILYKFYMPIIRKNHR